MRRTAATAELSEAVRRPKVGIDPLRPACERVGRGPHAATNPVTHTEYVKLRVKANAQGEREWSRQIGLPDTV